MSNRQLVEKKPLSSRDLVRIKSVGDPQISPQGTNVALTVSAANLAENRYATDVWVAPASGGTPIQITHDGASSTPRWSPDGKFLAFSSSEKGKRLICRVAPDGTDRRVLTSYETSNAFLNRAGESLAWEPDGSAIAFLGTDESKPDYTEIVVMNRLLTKSLTELMDFRRTHIFTVSSDGGEPTQLTFRDFDEHSICWTPDSREIIFVSDRSGREDLFVRNSIWAVSLQTKVVRRITDSLGADYRPLCSPDGKWIAFLRNTRSNTSNDSVAEDAHLWLVQCDGKNPRDLVKALDRPISSFAWAPDSERILFTASDKGKVPLFSVSISTGDISPITSREERSVGRVASLSIAAKSEKTAYLKDDPTHPAEVYTAWLDGSRERRVTDFNKEFAEEFWFEKPENFWFKSFDGLDIQGWIVRPYGFDLSKKYPAILCVHGGPHGMFGYNFDERAQLLAGAGYVVIMVDPRGSSGYGQKFSDGCVLNWGGGDYQDLMAGIDHAIAKYRFIDEKRLGVTGGSYGGYMTNWIVTQTHRFKAAVSRACVSNLLTFYGTSMKFSLIEQEFNGLPYDNLDLLAQWSPITHVKNVKTPILFLHGEVDYTCPISESEEMFRGVKRMGVDTQLVRYQGEGHGITKKPSNRIDFYKRHLDWFAKYIG